MSNPLNESEFTQEELEQYTKNVIQRQQEINAAEELLKNKIVEEWTAWKQHPYTLKIIDKLCSLRESALIDAERIVFKKDANPEELIVEARTLRFVYETLINKPLINQPQQVNQQ